MKLCWCDVCARLYLHITLWDVFWREWKMVLRLTYQGQDKMVEYWRLLKITLLWRHNGHDGVSNHQPHGCLLNCPSRRRPKKTSKLRVTGLCAGNSPETCEFPAQMASNVENASIWWRHHDNILIQIALKFVTTEETPSHYLEWWYILLTHIYVIWPEWV